MTKDEYIQMVPDGLTGPSADEGRGSYRQGVAVAALFVAVLLTPIFKIGNLPPLRIDDLMVGILFFAAWMWSSRRGEGFFFGPSKRLMVPLLAGLTAVYLVTYLAGLAADRYPFLINDAFYTPASVLRLLLYFLIGASARPDSRGWRFFVWAVLIAGVAQAVVLMVQYHNVFGLRAPSTELWGGFEKLVADVWSGGAVRATGTLGNANSSGAALAMSVGAPLALLLFGRGMMRRVAIPLAAAMFMIVGVVMWTLSRSSTIMILASTGLTLFLLILFSRQKGHALLAVPIVLIAAAFLYANIDELPLPDRVKSIFLPTGTQESAIEAGMYSRTRIWERRMQEMERDANVLTGVGPSKYLGQTVDNDYVAALYKTGLFGLLLVLGLRIAVTIRSAANLQRMRMPAQSQAAVMLFFMNISLVLFGFTADITTSPKLGIIIALSAGLIYSIGASQRESKEDYAFEPALNDLDFAAVH